VIARTPKARVLEGWRMAAEFTRPRRTNGLLAANLLLWTAMKEGLLGDTLDGVHRGASSRRPVFMLHAGLDLGRDRLDVCLLSGQGGLVEEFAVRATRMVFGGWRGGSWSRASGCAG
jgi:hypothetical protein